MSHKTQFAGLTAPDEGDPPLLVDGGTFATRNPDIIDYFLRIGAVDHIHDGHPPLADPIVAASALVDTTGGSVPAGRDLYLGYTLLDKYGGETLISPVVSVSTPPPLADPGTPITAEYEAGTGDMVVGTFYFAVTLVDEVGGETALGPATFIERPPGDTNGQINLTGLAAELGPDAADHWRLWRADNGGEFHIIATGTDDAFTDDGINPTDLAASPPATSATTRATNMVTVTLPAALDEPGLDPAGFGSGFALYVSDDGAFASPALYGRWPVASAGSAVVITELDLLTGAPPDVSTSIPGAHKITAAELADGSPGGPGGGTGPLLANESVEWQQADGGPIARIRMVEDEGNTTGTPYGRSDFDDATGLDLLGGEWTTVDEGGGLTYLEPATAGDTLDAWAWLSFGTGTVPDNIYKLYQEDFAIVAESVNFATDDWNRIGVGFGTGDRSQGGIFAVLDRDAGMLRLMVKRMSDVETGGDEANWTELASVSYIAPVVGAKFDLVIQRKGTKVEARQTPEGAGTYAIGQIPDPYGTHKKVNAEIPADMLAAFGPWPTDGYGHTPVVIGKWPAGGGAAPPYQVAGLAAYKTFAPRWFELQLLQGRAGGDPTPLDDGFGQTIELFNDYGDFLGGYPFDWSFGLTPEADWAMIGFGGVRRYRFGPNHFTCGVTKNTGAAPADGDVIVTLDQVDSSGNFIFTPGDNNPALLPVVTGDDDGSELGWVEISAMDMTTTPPTPPKVLWRAGRSTDPATKHPFVRLEGVNWSRA